MAGRQKWPDELKRLANALRDEGLSYGEIGKRIGYDRRIAYDLTRGLRERGVQKRTPPEIKAKIREMVEEGGRSRSEIGRIFGVHYNAVARIVGPVKKPTIPPETQRAIADDLAGGVKTIRGIAAEYGLNRDAVRRIWATVGGRKPRKRPSRLPADVVARVIEMRRDRANLRTIATECNIALATVGRVLDRAAMDGVVIPRGRALLYRTPEERREAAALKRKERDRRKRESAPPRPKVERPKKVETPKEPSPARRRVHFAEPPTIDKSAERAAIEAFIAAGNGARYERVDTGIGRPMIQTKQQAIAFLERCGLRVETKLRGQQVSYYRIIGSSPIGNEWMRPTPLIMAVRNMAAETAYRPIPLRDVYGVGSRKETRLSQDFRVQV